PHGFADQGKLRDEVVGRGRPVSLVVLEHLRAEGLLRLVEDNSEMRRALFGLHLLKKLPQHVAEAVYGVDMRAVRSPRLEPDRVIGAKDVAGAVHQEQMIAFLQRARSDFSGNRRRRGFWIRA